MRLLITGASGFLGRFVVTEALLRGHRVRAMIRPQSRLHELSWLDHKQVEVACLDLRDRNSVAEAVSGVECVIHLAAAKRGGLCEQLQ